jgi:hypothetical protein
VDEAMERAKASRDVTAADLDAAAVYA